MSKLKALEEELNSYLYGVVSAWHQGVMPTESEVWSHVESVFSRVDSDRDRQQLQMNTVDLLGEALTYIRLDG